jgi:hypothetical protein
MATTIPCVRFTLHRAENRVERCLNGVEMNPICLIRLTSTACYSAVSQCLTRIFLVLGIAFADKTVESSPS